MYIIMYVCPSLLIPPSPSVVPNVDGLSDGLVQLLAQQRIQQLFSDGNDSSMSCDSHVIKHFSRHSNRQSSGGCGQYMGVVNILL